MPELPEVETVRDGLQRWVAGRTVAGVEVSHPRAVRRHPGGGADLAARLTGLTIESAARRGKYLWLPLAGPDGSRGECLVGHLGMSGQLLVRPGGRRSRSTRTSGSPSPTGDPNCASSTSGPSAACPSTGWSRRRTGPRSSCRSGSPTSPATPSIPHFDDDLFSTRLRRRDTELKRALLDQTLVSGIGNIYADESLWRARLSGLRRTAALRPAGVGALLAEVRGVLADALRAGGTSFDALYVNVNGESGYFDRSLAVYGQEGRPCPRCGSAIRRAAFMNRSSFSCPRCQRPPRAR